MNDTTTKTDDATTTTDALLVQMTADRDRLAAKAKTLARALLAWKRLGDRGFGDPGVWDCYEYRGWKLEMGGHEEYFTTEFEALAVKTACVNAHGLAEDVIAGIEADRPWHDPETECLDTATDYDAAVSEP